MGHLWDNYGTFVTFSQNKDVFTGNILQWDICENKCFTNCQSANQEPSGFNCNRNNNML
jgi:hypothetical protein